MSPPTCPDCKQPMKLMTTKDGKWWGCRKYPKCEGRLAWIEPAEELPKGFRAEVAKEVLLRIVDHPRFWENDTRNAGEIAVKVTDELIQELRKQK